MAQTRQAEPRGATPNPSHVWPASMQSERTQGFAADPVYGRAKCLPMLGSIHDLKDLKKDLKGFTADPGYGRAKCLPMLGEIKTQ